MENQIELSPDYLTKKSMFVIDRDCSITLFYVVNGSNHRKGMPIIYMNSGKLNQNQTECNLIDLELSSRGQA